MPARMASMFRNSPMTPVENGMTALSSRPALAARWAQLARASASPRWPVAALALPLFTTSARAEATRCRATTTGAA